MEPLPLPNVLQARLIKESAPQGAFGWNPEAWRSALGDLVDIGSVIDELPKKVDRDDIRRFVQEELSRNRPLSAFVAAMIWGHGTTGYGPIRVRWILTGERRGGTNGPGTLLETIPTKLEDGARLVREDGPLAAFRWMNNEGRIKYLGSAFFTKWLYFASAVNGVNDPAAAPILDRQVAKWLATNGVQGIRVDRTSSYQRYLELLDLWGKETDRSRVQIEQAIFCLATGRC